MAFGHDLPFGLPRADQAFAVRDQHEQLIVRAVIQAFRIDFLLTFGSSNSSCSLAITTFSSALRLSSSDFAKMAPSF